MRNSTRPNDRRTAPAGSAAAAGRLAAGGAGAGGGVPRRRSAPTAEGDHSKDPKLKHGIAEDQGHGRRRQIALRLKAGRPDILQVDVGDDGSADFSVRRRFTRDRRPRPRRRRCRPHRREQRRVHRQHPDDDRRRRRERQPRRRLRRGTLLGGYGNDTIDGNRGNDLAFLGAGDDTFVWDPGDGSDTVEGQAGSDTMLLQRREHRRAASTCPPTAAGCGSSATSPPSRWTPTASRRVDFNALGGADTVTVNDLTGTDVTSVNADLAGASAAAGDGAADR